MNPTVERSKELWNSRYLCAESVLMAVAESLDIQSDLIPRIATGFCSGIARTCQQCGAVSGAIMALGLVSGRTTSEETTDKIYAQTRQFLAKFEETHQSTNCKGLTGVDLGTDEGQQRFRDENLFAVCEKIVMDATEIVLSIMKE